jgi:hypothetical protein
MSLQVHSTTLETPQQVLFILVKVFAKFAREETTINPSSWKFWLHRGHFFVVQRVMSAFPSCFPIHA